MTPPQNRLEATPCCEDLAKYVLAEGVDVHLISKRSVEIICCGLTPLEFAQGGEGTFGIRSSKQNWGDDDLAFTVDLHAEGG